MSKNIHKPPGFAGWIFRLLMEREKVVFLKADFQEVYNDIYRDSGRVRAHIWYWSQFFVSLPPIIYRTVKWSFIMFKNYMKITFRNIKKQKGYSFINVMGLAMGMTVGILILLWVLDEVSVNQFHENIDDLFIVGTHSHYGNETQTSTGTPPALGPALKAEYPEIVNSARFINGYANMVLSTDEKQLNEGVRAADPSVLEMFSFPLVQGDSKRALSDPHSIVMTEQMAQKYFEQEDPIGQILTIDNTYDFTVTGILQTMPANSTLHFDFLVPINFFREYWELDLEKWTNFAYTTYVQLNKNTSLADVNQKIMERIRKGNRQSDSDVFLSPFADLYLHGLGSGGGRIIQVSVFAIIALIVILIACINFMNLTTARSANRAKEIGMRKVAGAHRKNVIQQFYSESIMLSFISLFFALAIAILLLPVFNNLTAKAFTLDSFRNSKLIFGFIGITLLTGLVAGSYPALFMSAFQPIKILRGSLGSGAKGSRFRKNLVVVQFVISIGLIIGTIIINKQLNYMQDRNPGFNKENLIYLRLNRILRANHEAAKQELLQNPNITNVTFLSFTPIGVYSNDSGYRWKGKESDTDPLVSRFCTDVDFLKTFQGEMAFGEFYSNEFITGSSDVAGKIIINEEFAKIMGQENPVGYRLSRDGFDFTIIGVVKNFNFMPLYRRIGPLALYHQTENSRHGPNRYRYMFLKISPEHVSQTVDDIRDIVVKYSPGYPFELHFLEESYGQLYRSEERMGSIIKYFSILAILISCLGLFGLASYMAEQRTKEIGIRKVLGSSESGIFLLLSREFVKWVAIANVIACPVSYAIMRGWLKNFAFRTSIGIDIFLLSASMTLIIALLTVGYQAIKVARANPVNVLKYE